MTHRSRQGALLLALAAAGVTLVGCGGPPTTKDFASKAESFIEGDMSRNSQLNGLTMTDAASAAPTSTKVGTEYSCTAMGSDGTQRTLTVKVAGSNTLQVTKLEPGPPADNGPGTGSTVPGATATTAAPATTTAAPATTTPGA